MADAKTSDFRSVTTAAKDAAETLPNNLAEAQKQNFEHLGQVSELMLDTARSIWQSQAELFRLEAEQASKAFTQFKPGADLGSTIGARLGDLHDNSDRVIAHIRQVSDLMRDYQWKLLSIFVDGVQQASKQLHSSLPSGNSSKL